MRRVSRTAALVVGAFGRPRQTHEVEDGSWGYYRERGNDGLSHITDAGVA
jgi:hypothetical protein